MSLNNFLFGDYEWARVGDLRRLDRSQKRNERRRSNRTRELTKRVEDLENDLGYVTLVLGSMLATLDEKGTITHQEVKNLMADLDDLDGVKDGRLDVDVLRSLDEPEELTEE